MQFSVVYGRNLTFIFYIISVYLLIPNSKFISLLSLFDSHTFVFYVCVYFCFVNKFICNIFQIPCIIAIILYSSFSFWFPTLRMTISRSIHVTANDISFFLMTAAAAAAKPLQSCPTLCDPRESLSLGFSRQEHRSGLPFPSPMHESEK